MRTLILAAAALASAPAAAQDHSGHAQDSAEPREQDAPEQDAGADHGAMDHGSMDHGTMDHGSMDHGSMDHGAMDHSGMDHGAMDPAMMDHGAMDHGAMDHGTMDHGAMDHGAMDHGTMGQDAMQHGAMDHGGMDHGTTDSGTMDHGAMDHSGHGAMADQPIDHSGMDHGTMDHSMMDHSAMEGAPALPASGPPPRAFEGPAHAADVIYGSDAMLPARRQLASENGDFNGSMLMLERLEARVGKGEDAYLWDAQGWTGGDIDKLWIKTEGEGAFGSAVEDAEVQALWSHAIGPWFDLQAGVRYDIEPDSRGHAVLGVQGLAPYMFELDAAAFLSDRGDLTARVEGEYDQRITQRLILQPRAEISLAAQDIPEIGVGSGVSSVEVGLRLRYEIRREFAPYVGVGYSAKLGQTADFAREDGEDSDVLAALIGLRAWF
jgi:copper resistance protein B